MHNPIVQCLKLLAACIISTTSLWCQASVHTAPNQFKYIVQTQPAAIAQTSTCIVGFASTCLFRLTGTSSATTDPYVCGVDLVGTGQKVTMSDANSVSWIVNGGVLGTASAAQGFEWHSDTDAGCRWFPGGVYIISDSGGATGRVVVKYNK